MTALRKVGPDATAEQLRPALAGLTGVAGIDGEYDFVAHPAARAGRQQRRRHAVEQADRRWDVVSDPRGAPQ